MSKKIKNIAFDAGTEFVEVKPLDKNPMISSVLIRIAKGDQVRNGYYLTKKVLQEAAEESLPLTPIVTLFNRFKGDFMGHGEQAILDNRGEYVTTADTEVVGVIPEKPVIYWDEEGYLNTIGYLWTARYGELEIALEGRPQSMELSLENSVLKKENGAWTVEKTDFVGLCILGKDVTPAYEGALVHGLAFSAKDQEKIKKDVDDFMPKLQFALDNNFDESEIHSPVIADVDGEEKDKEIREKVTDAIDILDEISGELDPVSQRDLDEAISGLVQAETEMKKEANIIPVTEAARRGLIGQPGYADGIVSTENLNYDVKGATKLDKKKEEELKQEVVEEKEVPVEEKKEEEVAATEVTEEKAEVPIEEKKPSEEESEPVAAKPDVVEGKEAAPEAVAKEEQDGAIVAKAGEIGIEAEEDPQGQAASSIGKERSSAAAKRTGALLSDISDDELFLYITERLEKTEDVKTRLQALLGNAIPEQLPENDNTEPVPSAIENQEPDAGNQANIGADQEPTKEEVVAPEEKAEEEVPAKEEAPVNEEKVVEKEEVAKEEAPAEDEEEEKKKKPSFSSEIEPKVEPAGFSISEIDVKEIVDENTRLTAEVKSLQEQLSPLLELKYSLEFKEKEDMLNEFFLSKEGKASIMANFNNLTVEEVEAQGALLQYKESKKLAGQKVSSFGIEFSLETDEADLDFKEEDSLAQLLRKTKESSLKE